MPISYSSDLRERVIEAVEVDLADVRFVPLLGEEGWAPEEAEPKLRMRYRGRGSTFCVFNCVRNVGEKPSACLPVTIASILNELRGNWRRMNRCQTNS